MVSKAHKPESGRCLTKPAAEGLGDDIEPASKLSQDQALTFADYRECAEHYSSTGRLEVYEELQGLLNRLGEQGVTLRYATRSLREADGQDSPKAGYWMGISCT